MEEPMGGTKIQEAKRAAVRGLVSSLLVLGAVLGFALFDLWLAPRSRGPLDLLGVHVREHHHHTISLSLNGILWWMLAWPLIAMLLTMRAPEIARRVTSPAVRLAVVAIVVVSAFGVAGA
jgi:hypothetical protein